MIILRTYTELDAEDMYALLLVTVSILWTFKFQTSVEEDYEEDEEMEVCWLALVVCCCI